MDIAGGLATAGSWLIGEKDAGILAAAANRDLACLSPMKERDFDDDVWGVITDSIMNAFESEGGIIVSSIVLHEPLKYEYPDISYKKTRLYIEDLNSDLSSVGELIADDYKLLNKYANEELAVQKIMNFFMDIPIRVASEVSVVVTILDILAGRYGQDDPGQEFLMALKAMSDAILGIVKSAVKVGFPDIPILGNMGELIEEILMIVRMMESLPDDVREEINNAPSTVNFSDKLCDVLDKTFAKLINRGAEDIDIIIQNIRWLPLTLLTGIVTGLIQAITKLFDKIGLGSFNIDDFIPDFQLIPSFEFDLSMFQDFVPPKNILQALLAALKMIPQFVTNFKNIFKNSIFGLLVKISRGFPFLDRAFWDPDKLLSATHVHLLSCQDVYGAIRTGRDLLQDCVNLQDYKDQIGIAEEKAKHSKTSKNPDENKHRALMAKYELNSAKQMYDTMSDHLFHTMKSGFNYIEEHDPGNWIVSARYWQRGTDIASMITEERNKEIENASEFGATSEAWGKTKSLIGDRLE